MNYPIKTQFFSNMYHPHQQPMQQQPPQQPPQPQQQNDEQPPQQQAQLQQQAQQQQQVVQQQQHQQQQMEMIKMEQRNGAGVAGGQPQMVYQIQSAKGCAKLEHNGYLYVFDKTVARGQTKAWRCESKSRFGCKARLWTDEDDRVLDVEKNANVVHSHEANPAEILTKQRITELKRRAQETMDTPAQIRAAVLEDIPLHIAPSKNATKKMIGRVRKSLLATPPDGTPLKKPKQERKAPVKTRGRAKPKKGRGAAKQEQHNFDDGPTEPGFTTWMDDEDELFARSVALFLRRFPPREKRMARIKFEQLMMELEPDIDVGQPPIPQMNMVGTSSSAASSTYVNKREQQQQIRTVLGGSSYGAEPTGKAHGATAHVHQVQAVVTSPYVHNKIESHGGGPHQVHITSFGPQGEPHHQVRTVMAGPSYGSADVGESHHVAHQVHIVEDGQHYAG